MFPVAIIIYPRFVLEPDPLPPVLNPLIHLVNQTLCTSWAAPNISDDIEVTYCLLPNPSSSDEENCTKETVFCDITIPHNPYCYPYSITITPVNNGVRGEETTVFFNVPGECYMIVYICHTVYCLKLRPQFIVCVKWVSVIGGLESWTGVLDWSTGLEYWSTGVLECTINWL